jgi:tetratricopeptide (TPR) repeat protein
MLIQAVCERIAGEPYTRLRYQCSPYYRDSAFYTIIVQLERAARLRRDDDSEQKLAKLEDVLAPSAKSLNEVAPLFAALLSIPTGERYPPLNLSSQRQRAKTFEALADQLVGLSNRQPVLMIFEDAQWSDPTTLDALSAIVHRVGALRVLAVITYRPEFKPPWPEEWHFSKLSLGPLSSSQAGVMVREVAKGKALPPEVLQGILAKAEGVPLFVEELTKTTLESGLLRETAERYELAGPLTPLAIPETLHDSLMARLDRLAPVKELAQIGAAIGREFSHELISAVTTLRDRELEDALRQLESAGLVFHVGHQTRVRYLFKHALVRDAAYESLLRNTRQTLHTRIANVLEKQFPEVAETEPELLAHHFTAAGLAQYAIPYWLSAGQRAYLSSAHSEAIAHLRRGLTMVEAFPEGPERAQAEVGYHALLGLAFAATKGYASPDTEEAYGKAYSLCQSIGEVPQLFQVLYGLFMFHWVRGNLESAKKLAEQMLSTAGTGGDATHRLVGETVLGSALWHMGLNEQAKNHLTRTVELYNSDVHTPLVVQFGQDMGVLSFTYRGFAHLISGYPDDGSQDLQSAVALARKIKHSLSLCAALGIGSPFFACRREPQTVLKWADECIAVSQEQGFPHWSAFAIVHKGWVFGQQGRGEEGLELVREGIAGYRLVGAGCTLGWLMDCLAETYLACGEPDRALRATDDAMASIRTNGERLLESPVLWTRGKALLELDRPGEAERCLLEAIGIAQELNTRWWELRAKTSLARLWQHQGKRPEARKLMEEICSWFTQGFDTPDYMEARTLLAELST